MNKTLETIWLFIVKSSADPKAYSLAVKSLMLGSIPYLMQTLDLVCVFGKQCVTIDASTLQTLAQQIADGVFYVLALIATLGFIWGTARKAWRGIRGEHLGLANSRK